MVYILLGTGFEEIEAIAPCDILRRGGVEVGFCGIGGKQVTGAHGITVEADVTPEALQTAAPEMIVVPGGMGGVNSILACKPALEAIRSAWDSGKFVAAICAGPTVLASLGITEGKTAVCYPGCEGKMGGANIADADAVQDGKLICGRAPGAAVDFGLALLKALRGGAAAEAVRQDLVYNR